MFRRTNRTGNEKANRSRKQRESDGVRNQSLIAAIGLAVAVLLAAPANSAGQTPTISSINPSSAAAGGGSFTLTVIGTNFDATAVVEWNGSELSTTDVSDTDLTASVDSSLIVTAGTATVTVTNIDTGQSSSGVTFTITPTIASISPSSAVASPNGLTLTVNGTGFDSSAVVQWNGSPLSTAYASSTQLTAQVTAGLIANPGTATVTVLDEGLTSNSATFTIIAPPTITSISPNAALAGGAAFTLTVNGSGFDSAATVLWNNSALPTNFVSATQLTATVPMSDIAIAGTDLVTVSDNSVTSNSATFTVGPNPVISSISPNSATAGGAGFTLTVNGSGFDATAVVQWNGSALTTTVVNSTQLSATVPATDIATPGTATVTVLDDGVTSAGATFTISPPSPVISSLSPNTATAGGEAFTLTVNGTGFVSGAVVQWNTTALSTTYVSATQLTAAVTTALIATPGTATVTVVEDSVTSAGATFTIAPPPVITSLSPNTATAGEAGFTLTVNGTGFVSGAVVQWNSTALATTFVSATQLTAPVAASLVATTGSATITVTENGVTSAGATFTIAPPPVITSLSPNTATAGQAGFTLTVNGTGFVSGAVVQWNSTALTTTFVSATQLTAAVTPGLVAAAGSATVTVTESGVISAGATFTIAPPPVITSLSPNTAAAGSAAFALTVNGTGFVSGAVVDWNGSSLSTTFVSATQLTATVTASLIATPATASVTVVENGVASGPSSFTVAAEPVITTLNPLAATAGGPAFTLTVNGTGFLSGAVVHWNTTALTTTFGSFTQLTAQVTANLIATPVTATVTVVEDGVTSAGATFTVSSGPVITSLSPNTATAGGPAFTLTVNGTGFAAGATVQWNGSTLPTSFLSSIQLTAQVAASLIATAGTATVTVVEGGVTSTSATFTIGPPPVVTSLSPNAAIAGGGAFTLTVNGSGFISSAVVRWNSTSLPTTFVSATQLTAQVAANLIATPSTAYVTVFENGVTSGSATFTVAVGPVITSLNPNSATAGGPSFTLTVNGAGFVSSAVVHWNSTTLTTTFVSAAQLTAQVTANLIATPGTATVTVVENGTTSTSAIFTIAAVPAITALSPSSAMEGGPAFTLTVNGTGFLSGAVVQWNGSALATSFVSASQLTAQVGASLIAAPGTATVTVVESGVTSTGATFTISAGPVITSLSPDAATAGEPAFTLTVNGTGFVTSAVVYWNSTSLTTTFVSATQLTAQVPASLIAAAGTANVTVFENGATSASAAFTIATGQVITSLSPNSTTAGGPAFTLTVNGAGFASGAAVQWNTTRLTTTYVSTTQLKAAVPASLIAAPGTASITVVMSGATSPGESFTIMVPSLSLSAPSTSLPTQNANLSLTVKSAVTTELTGTLALSFEANSSDANTPSGYQDPNMVFVSTGTTTIPFTIAANSTTATLGSNGAIQQGTVAGTITITMTSLLAGTADVLPQPAPTFTITVRPLAPVIEAGSVTIANLTATGFDVELNAFSTTRDLQEATFVFTGAPGSTLSGQTSFQVSFSSAAASYFGGSTGLKNGGNFGLTVHFTYSGDTSVISGGSVAVTVSNSVGTSSEVSGEGE